MLGIPKAIAAVLGLVNRILDKMQLAEAKMQGKIEARLKSLEAADKARRERKAADEKAKSKSLGDVASSLRERFRQPDD